MSTDPYDRLAAADPVLRGMLRRHGRPDPFSWGPADVALRAAVRRGAPARFAGLLLHIVGQQISTAVALTLFDRVVEAAGSLDPLRVARLGPERLHELGLSRAKAAAVAGVAEMHLAGTLDTARIDTLSDAEAMAGLTAARGVGPWTAQLFLIHQLRRPDVLPAGDLGIRHAVQQGWTLSDLPRAPEVRERGQAWAPYRTYAAALLWASLRPPGGTATAGP